MEVEINAFLVAPVAIETDCQACQQPILAGRWAVQMPGVNATTCGACVAHLIEAALCLPGTQHDPVVQSITEELRLRQLIGIDEPEVNIWRLNDGQRVFANPGQWLGATGELVGSVRQHASTVEIVRVVPVEPYHVLDNGDDR